MLGDFLDFYNLATNYVKRNLPNKGENYIARELHYRFKSSFNSTFHNRLVEIEPKNVSKYVDWSEWGFQQEDYNSHKLLPRKWYTKGK
nr:MAG TPA: hypothetical protein [Caudoviricetes sp.]